MSEVLIFMGVRQWRLVFMTCAVTPANDEVGLTLDDEIKSIDRAAWVAR